MPRTDAELASAAAGGEVGALGELLQRHHAGLLACAVVLVGRDDANDVVHDAFLVALRRIGELRNPEAAGAWLRAIVRSQALMRLRARRENLVDDVSELSVANDIATPEEALEQTALRDWVWAALEQLTEPLRLTTLLRYFGTHNSYEEIAAILGVPPGTVRSRLNRVRLELANALLKEASRSHPETTLKQGECERRFREAVESFNHGDVACFKDPLARDVLGQSGAQSIRGHDALVQSLHDSTPAAGVRVHFERVIASSRITVFEARLENPPHAPTHCPPATTQIHFHPNGLTERILFTFPEA